MQEKQAPPIIDKAKAKINSAAVVSVTEFFFGILQQNEYNPLESLPWVHLGAKLKLGCR